MKHNLFKRYLSFILVLSLLLQIFPVQVFATRKSTHENTEYASTAEHVEELYRIDVPEEIENKRTKYSKTFSLYNGLNYHEVHSDAIHFKSSGSWKEIDNTLIQEDTTKEYTYKAASGSWNVKLPRELTPEAGISVTKDNYSIILYIESELRIPATIPDSELTLRKARASVATKEENLITLGDELLQRAETSAANRSAKLRYPAVYPNTDIIYDLNCNQVKESVVIESPDANLVGYRYILDTNNLTPVLTDKNEIDFFANDEKNRSCT